jgi:hypothetical protein
VMYLGGSKASIIPSIPRSVLAGQSPRLTVSLRQSRPHRPPIEPGRGWGASISASPPAQGRPSPAGPQRRPPPPQGPPVEYRSAGDANLPKIFGKILRRPRLHDCRPRRTHQVRMGRPSLSGRSVCNFIRVATASPDRRAAVLSHLLAMRWLAADRHPSRVAALNTGILPECRDPAP